MQWKAIDTDSEYEVSDTGLVRKVHMMKLYTDRDGYKNYQSYKMENQKQLAHID